LRALRDADLREAVKTIPVPVLVIAGSDDPSTTAARAGHWPQPFPGPSMELHAAHLSNREQPGRFTAALLDFINGRLPVTDDQARYDAGLAVRRKCLAARTSTVRCNG
jgi:3-oxoadipate enol-lactonase/4-carboxymuconolactone decarboxylase